MFTLIIFQSHPVINSTVEGLSAGCVKTTIPRLVKKDKAVKQSSDEQLTILYVKDLKKSLCIYQQGSKHTNKFHRLSKSEGVNFRSRHAVVSLFPACEPAHHTAGNARLLLLIAVCDGITIFVCKLLTY